MFSTLRTRFGIPGVISVIALVFAMFGGAYAASNSSGGGKATASKGKGKPGPRGKTGKTGPAGPVGPQGAAGAKGDVGSPGDSGKDGTNGTNGTNGISPVGTAFSGEANGCKEGGVKFVGANTTAACNGMKGQTGFTKTLPSGETETGVFTLSTLNASTGTLSELLPISYSIPLAAGSAPTVNVIDKDGTTAKVGSIANCPGSNAEPKAEPGNLCLYADPAFTAKLEFAFGFTSGPSGAVVNLTVGKEGGSALGTWAVTAS